MSHDSMTDADEAPDSSDYAYQDGDFGTGETPGGGVGDLDYGGLTMPDGATYEGDGMYEEWQEQREEEDEEREEQEEEREEQEQEREQEDEQREEEDEEREERDYEMFGG